jgi:hypothetical protein
VRPGREALRGRTELGLTEYLSDRLEAGYLSSGRDLARYVASLRESGCEGGERPRHDLDVGTDLPGRRTGQSLVGAHCGLEIELTAAGGSRHRLRELGPHASELLAVCTARE